MNITLDKNVALPSSRVDVKSKLPLDDMEVGHSFFFAADKKVASKAASTARGYARENNKKFATKLLAAGDLYGDKPVDADGVAIWRVE
jgi:hypothetical protein